MTESSKEPDIPPELLKEYLEKEHMTPAKLAAHLNVAETTVHRWLKGEAKPTGTSKAVLWTLIGLGRYRSRCFGSRGRGGSRSRRRGLGRGETLAGSVHRRGSHFQLRRPVQAAQGKAGNGRRG